MQKCVGIHFRKGEKKIYEYVHPPPVHAHEMQLFLTSILNYGELLCT